MKEIILFIGAPGSGKGSRSQECKKKGFIHISSSKLLEDNGYDLSAGGIGISNETVLELIREKIKSVGKNSKIIIEGFPRKIEQAKLLGTICRVSQVIYLEISAETALKRVKDRIVCSKCKAPYSETYKKPKTPGICDECGGSLIHRDSDTEYVFSRRYSFFEHNTYPLIEFYKNKGVCVKTVDAETDFDIVSIINKPV